MSEIISYSPPYEHDFLIKDKSFVVSYPPPRQEMRETKISKCDKCCENCLLSAPNKELRYVLLSNK
jgi:hypothetical protein